MKHRKLNVVMVGDRTESIQQTVSSIHAEVVGAWLAVTGAQRKLPEGVEPVETLDEALRRSAEAGAALLCLRIGDQLSDGGLQQLWASLDSVATASAVACHVAIENASAHPRFAGEASVLTGPSVVQHAREAELDWNGQCAVLLREDAYSLSIRNDATVSKSLTLGDVVETALSQGDLVYLPQTLVHRAPSESPPEERTLPAASRDEPILPLGSRPLFPLPWWSKETRELARIVLDALETPELPAALAALASTDEASEDLALRLLRVELESLPMADSMGALTELLQGNEWYAPAQMKLVELLRQAGELELADQILEALHGLVPLVVLRQGFVRSEDGWMLERRAVIEQTVASTELELTLGVTRPAELAHTDVGLRMELAGVSSGQWTWAADGTTEELLKLSLPSCTRGRLVTLCWDEARAPFGESTATSMLTLNRFEIGTASADGSKAEMSEQEQGRVVNG